MAAPSVAVPGFVHRVAKSFKGALHASRLSGDADLAAMMDHFMRELNPVVPGDDLH